MPKLSDSQIPAYRLHRQSGQAVVTLSGKDVLLGKHGTNASKSEYRRVIGEWLAAGRQLTQEAPDLTIAELIARYKRHVENYYRRPDGSQTSEVSTIRYAMQVLRDLYGGTFAREFGPLRLEAVRNRMIEKGWCRSQINKQISRIKRFFAWCTAKELLPVTVHTALTTVRGLSVGRTGAKETEPVMPVEDAVVTATLPHLNSVVAAMVRVQRYAGMRPNEVCSMRLCDIDRTTNPWIFTPPVHKMAYKGFHRAIHIGPKGQKVLQPFMRLLDSEGFIFRPKDAIAEMRQRRAENRKTPLSCGNKAGTNRVRHPKRAPGEKYDSIAYCHAVHVGCDRAFPVPAGMTEPVEIQKWRRDHRWSPNRLRHSAGTEVRAKYGLEGAQVHLGHKHARITETYAERNGALAAQIAAAIG